MKGNYLKTMLVALVGIFLAVGVTFSADELSKASFKVDTKDKEAKVKIETVVNMLKGVSEAEFDLNSKKLVVTYDPKQIEEAMISFAVESMGYPIAKEKPKKEETRSKNVNSDSTKK
ncbi:MAG: hypothetical protein CH6_4471 [Candidatus Kapaibacterium sp.]|jgi:copper chaperone CopZ|nr:MAG: hypothetical protein CH6_4471 [Candidatus Kapabacteria bacterium]ROL58600.1 MAG: heavy-metal-associated domain-containing protein [Bacteroidetes/Chlorobi group bacterium Naka2016]